MSPVPHPNAIEEEIIANSGLNAISSSDELDPTLGNEQVMDLG